MGKRKEKASSLSPQTLAGLGTEPAETKEKAISVHSLGSILSEADISL